MLIILYINRIISRSVRAYRGLYKESKKVNMTLG
jgi:hypothetical protein